VSKGKGLKFYSYLLSTVGLVGVGVPAPRRTYLEGLGDAIVIAGVLLITVAVLSVVAGHPGSTFVNPLVFHDVSTIFFAPEWSGRLKVLEGRHGLGGGMA
jgi:hypothetical protein